MINDHNRILSELKTYYSNLYQSNNNRPTNCYNEFITDNVPKLTNNERDICEGRITLNEAYKTLCGMTIGKTPGNDGIPVEFYLHFWPKVGHFVVNSSNYGYDHGILSTSQRQSIIKLIDKKGKDKQLIKNWRPISLINVDAKIRSRCIAKRMEKILPNIIHCTQSAFVQGRDISDCIRMIDEIMSLTDEQNLPGILLAIDFQKAFDSLEWDYLYQCLHVFNFGPSLIQWIKAYYNNIESSVIDYGYTTGYFKLGRGVRQGDPLSPALFIIALETLLIAIRCNSHIHGFKIGSEQVKSIAFADDLTCPLADENSVTILFNLLERFHNVSGLKNNKEKTEVIWLGKWKKRKNKLFDINWPTEPIKIVGIYVSYDKGWAAKLNYNKPLEKLETTLNFWRQRDLTILGKIQVVKSLAVSKFVFLMRMTSVPKGILKEINKKIFNFIWNGTDKVARNTLMSDIQYGGLKAPDIVTSYNLLRISWIQRYLDTSVKHPWKEFLQNRLKRVGGNLLFNCNFDTSLLPVKLGDFYLEALSVWTNFRNLNENSTMNGILWNNKNITVDGKSVSSRIFMTRVSATLQIFWKITCI